MKIFGETLFYMGRIRIVSLNYINSTCNKVLILVLRKRRVLTFGCIALSKLSSRPRMIGHLHRLLREFVY